MNTNTICCYPEEKLKNKSPLRSFLDWFLNQKIDGAEEMSKTK